jgi:hypothetical protein
MTSKSDFPQIFYQNIISGIDDSERPMPIPKSDFKFRTKCTVYMISKKNIAEIDGIDTVKTSEGLENTFARMSIILDYNFS